MELTAFEKQLLNRVQTDFPLVEEPFAALARDLASDEATVLAALARLKAAGVIRRIGPVYDAARHNLHTTLVAATITDEQRARARAVFAGYPGITHAYIRNEIRNLWFTVAARDAAGLRRTIAAVTEQLGLQCVIDLPTERMVKIGVSFRL